MSSSIYQQRLFWNDWNTRIREEGGPDLVSIRRCREVFKLLHDIDMTHPDIIELGCGTGWMSSELTHFGTVTATDLADEVIERAKARYPTVNFFAGDIMTMDLGDKTYDIVVCMETFSCIEDQAGLVDRMADILEPHGWLILTTHNKYVFDRREDVMPQAEGQIRKWTSIGQLRRLLNRRFKVMKLKTVFPSGRKGFLHVVNSVKLNNLLKHVFPEHIIEAMKEWLGYGQTIVVLAHKKVHPKATIQS
jgi:SAM-dependent methyltransferase